MHSRLVCLVENPTLLSWETKKAPNFFTTQKLVIQWERAILYERINLRVDQMIAQGLEQEAKKLYPFKEINALQTVGYQEWFTFFDGSIAHEKVANEIKKKYPSLRQTPNNLV